MAANSSVYFLRFPFADESGILSGFSFMNESKKKYVIILIIFDKLRFIIKNKIIPIFHHSRHNSKNKAKKAETGVVVERYDF